MLQTSGRSSPRLFGSFLQQGKGWRMPNNRGKPKMLAACPRDFNRPVRERIHFPFYAVYRQIRNFLLCFPWKNRCAQTRALIWSMIRTLFLFAPPPCLCGRKSKRDTIQRDTGFEVSVFSSTSLTEKRKKETPRSATPQSNFNVVTLLPPMDRYCSRWFPLNRMRKREKLLAKSKWPIVNCS